MEGLREVEAMDATVLPPLASAHVVAIAAGFLTVGYFLGRTHKSGITASPGTSAAAAAVSATPEKRRRRRDPLEVDRLAESHEDFKMVG